MFSVPIIPSGAAIEPLVGVCGSSGRSAGSSRSVIITRDRPGLDCSLTDRQFYVSLLDFGVLGKYVGLLYPLSL